MDSLASLILGPAGGSYFRPTSAAYDAALGTDAWRRIPPEVKVELARFADDPPRNEETIVTQSYIGWTRVMSRHGGFFSLIPSGAGRGVERGPRDFDYERLLADQEFEAWVTLHFIAEGNLASSYGEWLEQLREIDRVLADF